MPPQQQLEGALTAGNGTVKLNAELNPLTFAINQLKSQGSQNAMVMQDKCKRDSLRD